MPPALKVGQKVFAQWDDAEWYTAVVLEIFEDKSPQKADSR
jgi:hypothetical protein